MSDEKIEKAIATDNIIDFTGITKLDLDPDRILKWAMGELSEVVLIGYTKDGDEYFASSKADGAQALWHLERAKLKLLNMVKESGDESTN